MAFFLSRVLLQRELIQLICHLRAVVEISCLLFLKLGEQADRQPLAPQFPGALSKSHIFYSVPIQCLDLGRSAPDVYPC
jgi:hypothetical protein